MKKASNASAWIEVGYDLFAREGIDGLQVERLARILQFNKSSFYHYFGDLECFCQELLKLHEKKADLFLNGVRETKVLDPDYLQLLIDHTDTVMFQVQLTRHKEHHDFYELSLRIDQQVNTAVRQLWCDFLDIHNNSDLAIRYYAVVRDMFYTRVSFKNLNYSFLHGLVSEAKGLVDEMKKQNSGALAS